MAKIVIREHTPQAITANKQISRLREGGRKDIRFKHFPLAESTVKDIALRVGSGFIRGDLAEFLQAFDQGMIAGQRLDPSIRADGVGAAVTDMADCHLLAKHQRSRQGSTAAGSCLSDSPSVPR